jgi:outer membrane protein assembly factor BamB
MRIYIKSLILLGVMFLAACSWFEDEDIKPAPLVRYTPVVNFQTVWSNRNYDGAVSQYLKLTPAFANGKAFTVCYKGFVKAIAVNNGHTLWNINLHTPLTSGVAADESLIYLGTGKGQILALRQIDGAEVWRADLPSEVLAAPAVAAGKVFIKSEDGQITAFDAKSGRYLWKFQQAEPSLVLRGSSVPKIVGNTLFSGFADGQLVALNINTGALLWQYTIAEPTGVSAIDRMTDIDSDPVIVDGTIYITSYRGHVAALTLSGKELWQRAVSSYAGLAVDSKNVYVATAQGWVWALNRETGNIVWRQEALLDRNLTAPLVYRNTIIVGDKEGYLHCMAINDGHFIGRTKVDNSGLIVSPLATSDGIFVMTRAGRLVKFQY